MGKRHPVYGRISGPIVMIGFGSIGRGVLPLIHRHFDYDRDRFVIISPDDANEHIAAAYGVRFLKKALTPDNYRDLLTPLLAQGGGQGFCVNLSVDVGSLDVMKLCRELNALYIDTSNEPWSGFYDTPTGNAADRTVYAMRETVRAEKYNNPGGATAITCCGANPGMVSWLVKEALLNLADDLGLDFETPTAREGWASLMRETGVKGIHIAERDTQRPKTPPSMNTYVGTWCVESFITEGLQPAEIGWGTHEKWMPANGRRQKGNGCRASIYLEQSGVSTRVRTWCPTPGPQYGFLMTHNEAVSISDYFTVGAGFDPLYRPTCHYAYHPTLDALASLHKALGETVEDEEYLLLEADDIAEGVNELGVLLYGHARNAYWFGSRLSIDETRLLAPHQNATALQVTSAVLAGMVWALENPAAGIVETEEMDHSRCLQIQKPYLGPVEGHYTGWHPLRDRSQLYADDIDKSDPWQFKNVLVRI